MFITVQVVAPVQLVRRRTGEHVSNPIQEYQDGGAPQTSTTAFQFPPRAAEPAPTDIESSEVPTELQLVASEEMLVAASTCSANAQSESGRDIEKENEQRRRAELDRPIELRRLLSQLHELSMLSRPAKQTFIQHMDHGMAKATLRVWRGALTIGASIQSFNGVASHFVRGSRARGTGARLRGEGRLDPDGSINGLRLDVELDPLPALGPIEQAELDRLKGSFVQLHQTGMEKVARAEWSEAHQSSARRRPDVPLMLLVAFLTDLERRAVGLLAGPKPQRNAMMLTLHDLLEGSDQPEPPEPIAPETRLNWIDDYTPALDIPGCDPDQLRLVNDAFRRLLAYLPQAWSLGRRVSAESQPVT